MQRYKCLQLHGSGRHKWFNLVSVEDAGLWLDMELGESAAVYFGGCFVLCKEVFAKILSLGYKMLLKPLKLERNIVTWEED